MQKILLKIRYFRKGLSKSLKGTLFLLSNPDPFNRQNYQKQKGPGTGRYSVYEATSEKFLYFSYVLSDRV